MVSVRLNKRWLTPAMLIGLIVLFFAASCSSGSDSARDASAKVDSAVKVDPAVAKWRGEMADRYDITNPPDVAVVQYIKPEDSNAYIDPCMSNKGFASTGPGEYSYPVDQQSAFDLARYICTVSYPPDPKYLQPWTDVQTTRLYDYMVATEIPCLQAEGFSISGVPSEETFVANFSLSPFWPYEQVQQQLASKNNNPQYLDSLEGKCPQQPSSDVLYA